MRIKFPIWLFISTALAKDFREPIELFEKQVTLEATNIGPDGRVLAKNSEMITLSDFFFNEGMLNIEGSREIKNALCQFVSLKSFENRGTVLIDYSRIRAHTYLLVESLSQIVNSGVLACVFRGSRGNRLDIQAEDPGDIRFLAGTILNTGMISMTGAESDLVKVDFTTLGFRSPGLVNFGFICLKNAIFHQASPILGDGTIVVGENSHFYLDLEHKFSHSQTIFMSPGNQPVYLHLKSPENSRGKWPTINVKNFRQGVYLVLDKHYGTVNYKNGHLEFCSRSARPSLVINIGLGYEWNDLRFTGNTVTYTGTRFIPVCTDCTCGCNPRLP